MHPRIRLVSLRAVCLLLFTLAGSLAPFTSVSAANTAAQSATPKQSSAMQSLLEVLQNDQQRAQLVAALEKATAKGGEPAEKASSPPPQQDSSGKEKASDEVVSGGILGALSSGFNSLQDSLTGDTESRWLILLRGTGHDIEALTTRPHSLFSVSAHFAYALVEWLILSVLLTMLGRKAAAHIDKAQWASQRTRIRVLAKHWLSRPLPLVVAFLITFNSTFLIDEQNIGSTLALAIAYAISAGTLIASFIISLALIGNGRHRRRAVKVIYQYCYLPLIINLSCVTLAEALISLPLTQQLGPALSQLAAVVFASIASIVLILLALWFRRPVAQILFNRSLSVRHRRPLAVARGIFLFSRLWPVPIILMSITLLYHTMTLSVSNGDIFAQLILSFLLFVAGIMTMALVRLQILPHPIEDEDDQSRKAVIDRLRGLAALVCTTLVACVFIEFICRVWGFSPYHFFSSNYAGRLFGGAVTSTLVVLVVAITCWVIADAVIQRTLNPDEHSRYGQPSLRVRTLLPLVRNALKVLLAVVSVITILANIGINIAPLIASAGMVGLAVSLGAQQLVKDVISGFFNIIENTMSIGDSITVNGVSGTVENISIRTLSLRDSNGALNLIPFSQVNQVRNTSRNFAYALISLNFTLASDIDEMLTLVKQAGEEVSANSINRIYLLGSYENYGLSQVTEDGYVVTGRFRTTTSGTSTIQRAFQLALAKRVAESDKVFYARTYVG